MQIELEIDDKYKDTNLYLMWGMVPVARWKWKNQYWEVKTEHCSRCGECCRRLEGKSHPFRVVDGVCEHLTGNICSLSSNRPFSCSVGVSPLAECTVRWERYK